VNSADCIEVVVGMVVVAGMVVADCIEVVAAGMVADCIEVVVAGMVVAGMVVVAEN